MLFFYGNQKLATTCNKFLRVHVNTVCTCRKIIKIMLQKYRSINFKDLVTWLTNNKKIIKELKVRISEEESKFEEN